MVLRSIYLRPQNKVSTTGALDCFKVNPTGNIVVVNELIAADKQAVHAVDKDGATPLMFAAMRGHTEVRKEGGACDCALSVHDTRCAEC